MKIRRILLVTVLALLAVSSGAAVASGDDGMNIFDWIDEVSKDDGYYGIGGDPYIHFSGDSESVSAEDADKSIDDAFTEDMSDKEAQRALYKIGDYTFDDPQADVRTWNQRNRFGFWPGQRKNTIYPQDLVTREEFRDGENNRIKDAYVTFFSLDPSTVVHIGPGSSDSRGDVTEYRVGKTVNINLVHSARTNDPIPGRFDGVLDRMTRVTVENYGVEYTRIYASNCGNGRECIIDEKSNPDQLTRFNNVVIPTEGQQTLTAESKYAIRYNISTYSRSWVCDPLRLPFVDSDGDGTKSEKPDREDRPEKGTDDSDHWSCEWTKWELISSQYPEDEVVVSDTIRVISTTPDAQAWKANFPGGQEAYYIHGLDRAEWSKITFAKNGEERLAAQSAWRFFSSRDQRWDTYCQIDGRAPSGKQFGDPCGNYDHDRMHFEASNARPLVTHAIPSPLGVTTPNNQNALLEQPDMRSYSYPNVRYHKTCMGDCEWRFPLYQDVETSKSSYEEPRGVVLQHRGAAESVRVYGLVDESASEVDVTRTREVHLATIGYTKLFKGGEIPESRRGIDENLPEEDEIRVKISIYDEATKQPINLLNREGEYLRISDGKNTYTVKPGSDGVVTMNLKQTTGTYEIKYVHRNWWNVPLDEKAYVTKGTVYKNPSQPYDASGAISTLFNLGVMLLIPLGLSLFMVRAMGMEATARDLWKIVKDEWFP